MELLVQIYVVYCLRGADDTLYALLVEVEWVYWVVKIYSEETGVGLALEDVHVVVPEVNVAVTWPKDRPLLVALHVHYLPSAYTLPPDNLEVTIPDNDKLTLGRTT